MRRLMFWTVLFAALFMIFAPAASAERPANDPAATWLVQPPTGLPMHFARLTTSAPIYRTLDDAVANRPQRWMGGPDTWVSVYEGADRSGSTFYRTGYGWMPGHALSFAGSTSLQGVDLRTRPGERLAMVYWPEVNIHAGPGPHTAWAGTREGYDIVSILEEVQVGRSVWYRIGDNQWIDSQFVRHFRPSARPAGVGPGEKWIEVNLTEQTVMAHEGDTPIYATIASTGRPPFNTVTGLYRIYQKHLFDRMQGGATRADMYDLADVPWTMYWYQGYALHSAYWHDAFGAVRSHGCVNLSPVDSKWFFDWAGPVLPEGQSSVNASASNPGTPVWVHY